MVKDASIIRVMSMHEIEAPTFNRSKYAPPYPPYFIALLALEYIGSGSKHRSLMQTA